MEVNMEGKQTSLIQRMLEAADLVVEAVKLKRNNEFFFFSQTFIQGTFLPSLLFKLGNQQ